MLVKISLGIHFVESFITAVPSHLPDLVFYDAIVPVKMELDLIMKRLQNKYLVCISCYIASITHSMLFFLI